MKSTSRIIPESRNARASLGYLAPTLVAMSLGICCGPVFGQTGPKHASAPTHQTLMDYAGAKASELATPLTFTTNQSTRMREGVYDEDYPETRCLNHAYNPVTDSTFTGGSMTAPNAALDRWNGLTSAFASGNFDGDDGVGAWHFLGRASHLLQDMTSPLHALALWHTGVTEPACQYEAYWETNDTSLRAILASIGGPLHSSTLDAQATEKLDTFTAERLAYRFNNSCPNKANDDVRGWLEVLAWASYMRTTFWGEVSFGNDYGSGPATAPTTTPTTFTDGTVGSKPNVLHTMFNGNVQWISGWADNYYEITDRCGYLFRWMSWTIDLGYDDWCSCGRTWGDGYQESARRPSGTDDDDYGVRITGRFWFDVRELGKTNSGTANRYCYPNRYPDGTAMTDHLHEYYGKSLYPLTVRYNAGLLGLANRRVVVKTADATEANGFSWGRKDNYANGPSFNTGSGGQNFYFAAKSAVTLTAPATNASGRTFVRWLRDGVAFGGNDSRMITINDAALPIPSGGVIYTAEYQAEPIRIEAQSTNGVFRLSVTGLSGQRPVVIETTTNFISWTRVFTNATPGQRLEYSEPCSNEPARFYRAVQQ